MSFKKGDVISFDFEMPDTGEYLKHSAVVLSCDEMYQHEKCYLCAMMTSNGASDRFTFKLEDDMMEKPNIKNDSQVRCHLITYVWEGHIGQTTSPLNRIKPNGMARLIERININVFDN
jgi:hypothetical protein